MGFILVIAITITVSSGGPKTFEIKMPQESHLSCKEAERSFELNLPRLGAFVLVESKCLSITDANNPSIFT